MMLNTCPTHRQQTLRTPVFIKPEKKIKPYEDKRKMANLQGLDFIGFRFYKVTRT